MLESASHMGLTASLTGRQKLRDFVSWFEIPVYDIHRAAQFYNAIYLMEMQVSVNGDFAMAFFPANSGIGGALVAGPGCTPNATGVLIYLNAGSELDHVLARVEPAGGRVIMPRTLIDERAGAFALFIDSEGNRLALHQGPSRTAGLMSDEAPAPATSAPEPAVKAKAARTTTRAKAAPNVKQVRTGKTATPGAKKRVTRNAKRIVRKR